MEGLMRQYSAVQLVFMIPLTMFFSVVLNKTCKFATDITGRTCRTVTGAVIAWYQQRRYDRALRRWLTTQACML